MTNIVLQFCYVRMLDVHRLCENCLVMCTQHFLGYVALAMSQNQVYFTVIVSRILFTAPTWSTMYKRDVCLFQVCLRWQVQRGVVVIPKSLRAARMVENSQVSGG